MRLIHFAFYILHSTLAICAMSAQTAQIIPAEPRCEHRDNPHGIREARPRLTWRLEAASPGQRGLTQTAWQILVASSPAKLAAGEADIWDSGRVESTNVRAVFAGKKLEPNQQAWWKLRVWDGANSASPWSEPATWSCGLPDIPQRQVLPEWPGTWIGLDEPGDAPGPRLTDVQRLRARAGKLKWIKARMNAIKPRPAFDEKVAAPPTDSEMPATHPLTAHFKKTFPVEKAAAVESAVIWIVPDMVCEIHVNDGLVETVARWELARPIDIAPFLKDGENTILLRITQEDGYAPAALGEIELTLASQSQPHLVPLDDTWQFAESDTARPPADSWKKVHTSAASPWGTPENATHRYSPAPYMRKEFSIIKPLRRAILYATAAGIYEIELNGRRVGEGHFAPGWTEYTRRLHVHSLPIALRSITSPS